MPSTRRPVTVSAWVPPKREPFLCPQPAQTKQNGCGDRYHGQRSRNEHERMIQINLIFATASSCLRMAFVGKWRCGRMVESAMNKVLFLDVDGVLNNGALVPFSSGFWTKADHRFPSMIENDSLRFQNPYARMTFVSQSVWGSYTEIAMRGLVFIHHTK